MKRLISTVFSLLITLVPLASFAEEVSSSSTLLNCQNSNGSSLTLKKVRWVLDNTTWYSLEVSNGRSVQAFEIYGLGGDNIQPNLSSGVTAERRGFSLFNWYEGRRITVGFKFNASTMSAELNQSGRAVVLNSCALTNDGRDLLN
jgi:hypothetical protein